MSSGQIPRTPEHFPRMKHRAAKRIQRRQQRQAWERMRRRKQTDLQRFAQAFKQAWENIRAAFLRAWEAMQRTVRQIQRDQETNRRRRLASGIVNGGTTRPGLDLNETLTVHHWFDPENRSELSEEMADKLFRQPRLNSHQFPFSDDEARQALADALDRAWPNRARMYLAGGPIGYPGPRLTTNVSDGIDYISPYSDYLGGDYE